MKRRAGIAGMASVLLLVGSAGLGRSAAAAASKPTAASISRQRTSVEQAASTIALVPHRSRATCRRALPELPHLCDLVTFEDGEHVESARPDIDRDGQKDLVVRQLGLFACGGHNCPTPVFLFRRGQLRQTEPHISAAGPISRCDEHGKHGLRMLAGGPCFIFEVAKVKG